MFIIDVSDKDLEKKKYRLTFVDHQRKKYYNLRRS